MPAILTADQPLDGQATYGLVCPDHPSHAREGLTMRHAMNAVAKHNRDHHPGPALNLGALARYVESRSDNETAHGALLAAWEALTGLPEPQAWDFLDAVLSAPEDTLVHVAPF